MNFGKMNIHELDKNKSYICEAKITKQVAIDKLYAYLKSVEDVFEKAGITKLFLSRQEDLHQSKN